MTVGTGGRFSLNHGGGAAIPRGASRRCWFRMVPNEIIFHNVLAGRRRRHGDDGAVDAEGAIQARVRTG